MYTVSMGGGAAGTGLIELGANWIHGAALTNSVYSLAASHRLLDDQILLDR